MKSRLCFRIGDKLQDLAKEQQVTYNYFKGKRQ